MPECSRLLQCPRFQCQAVDQLWRYEIIIDREAGFTQVGYDAIKLVR